MSGSSNFKDVLDKTKGVDIHNEGKKIISAMSPEERSVLRSKCHTLHFVKLLKLASKRADRMVAGQETRVSYKAVGVVLYSDEDIVVPDIPVITIRIQAFPLRKSSPVRLRLVSSSILPIMSLCS